MLEELADFASCNAREYSANDGIDGCGSLLDEAEQCSGGDHGSRCELHLSDSAYASGFKMRVGREYWKTQEDKNEHCLRRAG